MAIIDGYVMTMMGLLGTVSFIPYYLFINIRFIDNFILITGLISIVFCLIGLLLVGSIARASWRTQARERKKMQRRVQPSHDFFSTGRTFTSPMKPRRQVVETHATIRIDEL